MTTKLQVCNMALAHLGVGKEIVDFDTDRTSEAAACRLFYDHAIDELFRDFAWPNAKKTVELQLVEEDPNVDWAYAYRYPDDAARIHRIPNGASRIETRDTRIAYQVGYDSTGARLIYTDEPDATLEYTMKLDDPTIFPSDVVSAFAFLLAGYIAPRVTGGDQFKLGERAIGLYNWSINKARANAANEELQGDQPAESEFISVRE
jgi:hypothetical protein